MQWDGSHGLEVWQGVQSLLQGEVGGLGNGSAPLICGADGASLERQSKPFLLLDLPPKAWAIH
jgi:hypothetical protein